MLRAAGGFREFSGGLFDNHIAKGRAGRDEWEDVVLLDDLGNPDFVKLAQAYGIKAFRIKRPGDVGRILHLAQAYDEGPCVVVAEVVKEDNVFPFIPAGATLGDMIIEKPTGKLAKPTGST